MFELGAWGEILIIFAVALILLGPKDIPRVMQLVGRWVYKFRSMSQEVRSYVDELAFQAQREDIIKKTRQETEPKDSSESKDGH